MDKVKFKDLSGWLKAAIIAIPASIIAEIYTYRLIIRLVEITGSIIDLLKDIVNHLAVIS